MPSVTAGVGWNNTLGKLPITGAYGTATTGSGVLAKVYFEVIGLGDSELFLSEDTGLMNSSDIWVSYGRDFVQDGYFRNIAWPSMPKADFTITPVGTPDTIEGYDVNCEFYVNNDRRHTTIHLQVAPLENPP